MRFYIQKCNRKNNRPANMPGGLFITEKEVILCGSWMMPEWTRETVVHAKLNHKEKKDETNMDSTGSLERAGQDSRIP